jgi:antitoxin YefM
MTIEVSYSEARQKLASLLNEVTQDKEVVIINRRGGEPAALIAADELASLTETVHLLRSPANAERLLAALARALKGEGNQMTIEELSAEVGLGE